MMNIARKTDLSQTPSKTLDTIIATYSNTPKKCLGFKTPTETFIPVRFECESTPGSSPG